jgi:Lon protease-like protein
MKTYSLHIYPLNTVVCPNGLVSLKITKASYIEKIIRSKDQARLGLVTKLNESDCEHDLGFPFASTGTSVKIIKTKIDV